MPSAKRRAGVLQGPSERVVWVNPLLSLPGIASHSASEPHTPIHLAPWAAASCLNHRRASDPGGGDSLSLAPARGGQALPHPCVCRWTFGEHPQCARTALSPADSNRKQNAHRWPSQSVLAVQEDGQQARRQHNVRLPLGRRGRPAPRGGGATWTAWPRGLSVEVTGQEKWRADCWLRPGMHVRVPSPA